MSAASERGQTSVFVLGITMVALGVVAFAVDGTRAFLMRRSLQNAADAAAVAAASQLDREAYYRSGGRRSVLDPNAAETAATASLARRRLKVASAELTATRESVEVVLRTDMDTTFLGMIGIGTIPVAVSATSEPVRGPPSGN